jgi:hydrogenase/urease accessory protein HupE
MRRKAAIAVGAAISLFGAASGALAHPHGAEHAHGDAGQVIANGQNHPAFINGESCETFAHLPG